MDKSRAIVSNRFTGRHCQVGLGPSEVSYNTQHAYLGIQAVFDLLLESRYARVVHAIYYCII